MRDEVPEKELQELPEPELIRRGTTAWKLGNIDVAAKMLFAACDRLSHQEGKRVPAAALSLYAVCLARQGKLKEAVETCRKAISLEPYSAEAHLNMTRIYMVGNSRKKAVEALDKGLALSPRHRELLALRNELGSREAPVLSFLSRDNPLNIALGKARATLKKKPV
jgi:tetratricopeptide (TPR) repeat protein